MTGKVLNILTICLQLVTTFILLLGIFLFLSFLYNEKGFSEIVGFVLFVPVIGSIISALTIALCILAGLPLRLNKKINTWWSDHYFLPISCAACGLIFLFLSILPYFEETVYPILDGQPTMRQTPNTFLACTGWFLTAFMTLHTFPPERMKKIILSLFSQPGKP
jgi:hypothetical protein